MSKNGYGYMNDSEISGVSGGLSTKGKIAIGVAAGVAALATVAYTGKTVYNKKKSEDSAPSWKKAANLFSKAWWTGNSWD